MATLGLGGESTIHEIYPPDCCRFRHLYELLRCSRTRPFLFHDSAQPVVFFGDDATAQRMFTTLIETYTLSRFPSWKITFRNTGWDSDKILSVGGRGYSRDQDIRRDVESLRPQAVLVNYGMNDARGGDAFYQTFLVGVNILSRDLPRVGVNYAVFISPDPEEGDQEGTPAGSGYNIMLRKYAEGMKETSEKGWKDGINAVQQHPKGPELPLVENGIFIDVLNPMIQFIETGRQMGVLSSHSSSVGNVIKLIPDGVHPNWNGHFVMASIILEDLHAPAIVSSAVLDAGKHLTTSSEGCVIKWQDAPAGVVQFQREDAALPWPIPPEVDVAFKIPSFDPATTLNRYELKVTGLTEIFYRLLIDNTEIGIYSKTALTQGVNLGFVRKGPLYDQGQKILKAVVEKNDMFFQRWRTVQIGPPSLPGMKAAEVKKADAIHLNEVKPELERLDKMIADDEQAIHEWRQPTPHVFILAPTKLNNL